MPETPTTATTLPGCLIAIEGINGAGKTTQINMLAQRLRAATPRRVAVFREPGSTDLGLRLRDLLRLRGDLLRDETATPITPLAELLLFAAARAQLVQERLKPALQSGAVVLCDRFSASTVAYQGYGRGIDHPVIKELEQIATQGIAPNLVVLLDLDSATALARRPASDRFEQEEMAFHQRVRQGYLAQAEQQPERWVILDASGSPDAIAEALWDAISPLIVS